MARFYANENFPLPAVRELMQLGHDVLTSYKAGNANQAVADEEVLLFAASAGRTLLTQNRLHFLRLHRKGTISHAGIVLCTYDPDFKGLAGRIHQQVSAEASMIGKALRVYRPAL